MSGPGWKIPELPERTTFSWVVLLLVSWTAIAGLVRLDVVTVAIALGAWLAYDKYLRGRVSK